MGKNLNQVPTAATSILSTDKMYIARSPFGVTDDRYILGSDIIAQLASPLTTKGDLYTFSTVDARLPVGTIDGQILQVRSAAGVGIGWSTATYPSTTSINEILYSSAANVISGISAAASSVLITSAGSVPSLSQTLPSIVQDNITRLGTIVSGVWNGTKVDVPYGGTNATSFTAYMPICGGTTSTGTLQSVSTVGAVAGYALTYVSNAALPTWQAVGAPFTPSALTKVDDTNVTLTLGGTPATALLQAVSLTLGWTGTLGGTRGGTGVNNGTNTITIAGNLNFAAAFTTSGGFAVTQNYTGITNVTFPTSGTLATTSQLPTPAALTKTDDTNVTLTLGGTPATALLQATSLTLGWTGQLGLTRGGTNASLTASNGGIVYSTASAFAILSGTATANQMLQSGSTAAPTWSTTTWPATTTANELLYSQFNNTVTGLASANNGVLVTSGAGVPSWNTALGQGLQVSSSVLSVGGVNNIPFNDGKGIQDSNGNLLLDFLKVASAVNYIDIANAATGNSPTISAKGSNSNISLTLQGKGTSGVPIKGVTDASDAAAGYVGEIISSTILIASAVSISTATSTNLTSISLTAGDWDVWGNISFRNTGINITVALAWLNDASATPPDEAFQCGSDTILTSYRGVISPSRRFSLSSTTTIYISGFVTFAAGTSSMCGGIYARRVR